MFWECLKTLRPVAILLVTPEPRAHSVPKLSRKDVERHGRPENTERRAGASDLNRGQDHRTPCSSSKVPTLSDAEEVGGSNPPAPTSNPSPSSPLLHTYDWHVIREPSWTSYGFGWREI